MFLSPHFLFSLLYTVLDHSLEQHVYFVLTITEVSTIDKVVVLLLPASVWCVQFELP